MAEGGIGSCCALFCLFGPSFILQSIGFFAPNWVTTETCDAIGLFYRCCGKNNTGCVVDGADTYLNKAVLGLQATSFTIMALAVMSMCCLVNRSNDDDDDDEGGCLVMCLGCNVVLYPIGGLCSVIGCIVLATEYSTSELSWGFYLSVTAGCYIILLTTCCCCIVIRAARSDDSSGQNYGGGETTVATTQSSGQLTQGHRQSFTMEQFHERQEVVEANGMVFLRKIQVLRLFHISGSD